MTGKGTWTETLQLLESLLFPSSKKKKNLHSDLYLTVTDRFGITIPLFITMEKKKSNRSCRGKIRKTMHKLLLLDAYGLSELSFVSY